MSKVELRRLYKKLGRTAEFFIGTVVAITYVHVARPDQSVDDLYLVASIEVEELWLGERVWRKEVYTSAHTTACGVQFEVGKKFIVWGDVIGESEINRPELPRSADWTDRCGTKPFSEAVYQAETRHFEGVLDPWRPSAKRVSLEP